MCLIFVAHRAHPRYPLIVAANRDEFHARPTAPAAPWPAAAGETEIFAGRDLEAGGTWMGVTREGRFAALTNYRNPAGAKRDAPTRGKLVSGFLAGRASARAYVGDLEREGERYNGFSLLVHDGDELLCYSNAANLITELPAGVHGLSNHLLGSPWPKVTRGVERLAALLAAPADPADLTGAFFALLADDAIPADHELPETGVGLERERVLSPMFVRGEVYGTRSSTVLLVGEAGNIRVEERSFDAGVREIGRVSHEWRAQAVPPPRRSR